MKARTPLLACIAVLALVGHAQASMKWKPPEWLARARVISTSDLFPGYVDTGSDFGVETELAVSSTTRLSKSLKLGVEGNAGGQAYSNFNEARYGWVGAQVYVRRGGSRLVVENQWTPRRVKYPSSPKDASFERLAWRLGFRQNLPGGVRFRIEGRFERDDFIDDVPSINVRDSRTRMLFTRASWQPDSTFSLYASFEDGRRDADAPRYDRTERLAVGSMTLRRAPWSMTASVASGVQHYRHALPTDSNFKRRDQTLELTGSVARQIRPGLALVFGMSWLDQLSSRLERIYSVQTFRFGLEWAGVGP